MIRNSFKRLVACAVIVSAAGLASWAQAKVQVDLSSPKSTLTTMAKGMQEGDKEAVRAAVTGDEKQMRAVDMMVDLISATQKMQLAAKEKFGQIPDDQSEEIAKLPAKIEQAEVKIDGDSATVTMPREQEEGVQQAPNNPGEQIRLKKVGNDWKVDVADLSRGQELTDQQLEAGKSMVKAAEDIAQEIRDGKHATYQDAMQAYGGKMLAAMMQSMPQEQMQGPTTQPIPAE